MLDWPTLSTLARDRTLLLHKQLFPVPPCALRLLIWPLSVERFVTSKEYTYILSYWEAAVGLQLVMRARMSVSACAAPTHSRQTTWVTHVIFQRTSVPRHCVCDFSIECLK